MDTDTELNGHGEREVPTEGGALRRSSTRRMVAGVAGGLSERFDIDVTIVRAFFVVLTLLWGVGLALYLALWVITPRDDADTRDRAAEPEGRREGVRRRSTQLIAGVIALVVLAFAIVQRSPRWGGGVGVFWLVFLGVLAVLALRADTRRRSFTRVLAALVLVLVSLVILASGAFLGFVAMTGVPMAGGVGSRLYEPVSLTQVQPTYRLAFGSLSLDLRHVAFDGQSRRTSASVAVGQLSIVVPQGVCVNVSAQNGTSHIYYPQGERVFYATATSRGHLTLVARVGVGRLELVRASSGVATGH